MHLCTKAVVWGLFEVLSPAIVGYQLLFKEKLNAYIINEANFVTKPEHECHWHPSYHFHQKLDKNRIDPQDTFEKLLAIPDKLGTNPELLEYAINLVKLWSENLAYLWDRNKFIAAETVLKHHSITALKYDGIDALQKLLTEGLSKKPMRVFFQKHLYENQCSVEGLIDLKSVSVFPYHNLQCEILDWTYHPCQVIVTDVERSFLDEEMGVGWNPSDVETHFGL